MPIIDLVPKTPVVEDLIYGKMDELRARIQAIVVERLDTLPWDVIVNLRACPYRDADPKGANTVVYLETSPGEKIETMAAALCHALAHLFAEFGLTEEPGTEVWIRYISGAWCLITNGQIVDSTFPKPDAGSAV